MKIGFVLFNSPEKSETFLISKINNLIETGFDVVMFANQKMILVYAKLFLTQQFLRILFCR